MAGFIFVNENIIPLKLKLYNFRLQELNLELKFTIRKDLLSETQGRNLWGFGGHNQCSL